jgi:hypothetical protein
LDDVDGLTEDQLSEVLREPSIEEVTLDAQQLANIEKKTWSAEWAVDKEWVLPDWQEWEQDEPPPLLVLEKFKGSLATFPAMTGLG